MTPSLAPWEGGEVQKGQSSRSCSLRHGFVRHAKPFTAEHSELSNSRENEGALKSLTWDSGSHMDLRTAKEPVVRSPSLTTQV